MAKLNEAKNFSLSFTKVVGYFILVVLLGWWMTGVLSMFHGAFA